MEVPKLQEKSKTLRIKTGHCLLNRLSGKDKSLIIKDMGNATYASDNPAEHTGPYIDLALQFNIHDEVNEVFAFKNDENNSRKRLRTNASNCLLRISETDAGCKMTKLELVPRSLLVAMSGGKKLEWFSFNENSDKAAVENKAKTWQWAKIAECNCENSI